VKHNKLKCPIIYEGSVPYYGMLLEYEWVDDFVALEKTQDEIDLLKKERRKVSKIPVDKQTFLKQLHGALDKHNKRREAALFRVLRENRQTGDNVFLAVPQLEIPPYIDWKDVEGAVALLDDEGITPAAREKALSKIGKRVAELEAEIIRLSPVGFFVFKNGNVKNDARVEFLTHWRVLQADVSGPIGPQGVTLDLSPEPEKEAWKKLVAAWLDPGRGNYYPHPGEEEKS
jgi:hypothetical protein